MDNLLCSSLVIFIVTIMSGNSFNPIIKTPLGKMQGLELTFSETGDKIYQFRGIRYGKPTDGQRRFRKPEAVQRWDGVYNATSFGAICPQVPPHPKQSEDCLFLNVYVPKALHRHRLSVMVWIHGGGFNTGHGHEFDGSRLAVKGDVIIVTINYRLGLFGFMSLFHPSAKGNWGLWDKKLAIQWVHDNIRAFGGTLIQ